MRLIDADKLKQHYAWWNDERKELFDTIVDIQPTVEPEETKPCAKNCANYGAKMELGGKKNEVEF